MSDMPEKIFAEPPRLPEIGWAYWFPQDNSEYIDQTEYTRADLTYPKEQVDELIEVTKEISGRLKYSDTSDNGHVDSYSVELMDKARQAIAQLQANGTGGGDE